MAVSPAERVHRSSWLWPTVALAVAAAAFFPSVLFGGDFFFCRDGATLHTSMWTVLKARLAAGELPLWFPYDGLGEPFLAGGLSALFHPMGLALWLLPVAEAMRWTMLAAFAAAFAATYALGRALGNARWSAVCGALAFTFCGALLSLTNNPTYLFGGAVFPLFVLGVVRLLERPIAGAGLAAVAIALAALGGDVQSVTVMAVAGGLLVLVAGASWPERLRQLLALAGAGVFGVLLSAVQLFPAAATLTQVDRASGLGWSEATQWSMSPLRLPELFVGDLIRWVPGGDALNPIREHLIGSVGFWSVTLTVGVLPLVGAVFALVRKERTRVDLALAAAAALTLVLALGRHGGLYALAYRVVPLWSAFRFPEKLALHASLFIAVLGARGLERLWFEAREHRRFVRGSVAVAVALPVIAGLARALDAQPGPSAAAWATYFERLAWAGVGAAAVVAVMAVLVWNQARLFPWVAPLLVGVQLFPPGTRTVQLCTAPRWLAELPSQAGERLAQLEGGTTFGRARVTPAFSAIGVLKLDPAVGTLAPEVALSAWERQALYPDSGAGMQVETMGRIIPIRPKRFVAFHEVSDLRSWPLFNTRYVITSRSDLSRFGELRTEIAFELPQLDLLALRLPDALPRAFVAQPVPVTDARAAVARLEDPEVRSGRQVLVETTGAVPTSVATGTAQVSSYRDEQVVIDAELTAPGAVVLNDSFFDGWLATVDDNPAEILPANALVRAVLVGAGKHQIVFRYPPPRSLLAGAIVSGLAWLSLLLAAAVGWRRHRARRRPATPAP